MNQKEVFLLTHAINALTLDMALPFEKKSETQQFFIGLKQDLKIRILSKINIQYKLIRSLIHCGIKRYYLIALFGDKFPIILLFGEIIQKSKHFFPPKLYRREILLE